MSVLTHLLVGWAAGAHIATWGMYKDAIHEGFAIRKYVRSMVVAMLIAPLVALLLGLVGRSAEELVLLFGSTYALERAVTELWKTFIRTEDQGKYFIPMQMHVLGRVVHDRSTRLLGGLVSVVLAVSLLRLAVGLQPPAGESPSLLLVIVVSSLGGWFAALGGALKDAPIEGFDLLKFFRSPVVAASYGLLLSPLTTRLPLLALTAIGFTVATLETWKTFFFPRTPRGKFAGKPILFPDMLARRNAFVPFYVAIWIGVLLGLALALAAAR